MRSIGADYVRPASELEVDPRIRFFEHPHDWCPRCGASEAFHPEACDITPEEWRAASDAVDEAKRTGDPWRAIGLLWFAFRLRRQFAELRGAGR